MSTTIDHVGSKTAADVDNLALELRNWGRWGADDQAGTLNFTTPAHVVAAAALVRTGEIVSMAVPFGKSSPQNGSFGRFNPILTMLESGTDAMCGHQDHRNFNFADDMITMPLQCSTQWDALGHVFYDKKMYNGHSMSLVGSHGALVNSVVAYKEKLAGRGVLLDIARLRGVERLADGEPIYPDELDRAVAHAGVAVGEGDFVIVRTGQTDWCRRNAWGTYPGGDAPGLSLDTARWLYDKRVAAVAVDTWGAEVRPNEVKELYQPWHHVVIPNMGLCVGEIYDLGALGDACHRLGRCEFFFTAPALPIEGGVGSPINPLAIF